MKTLLLLLTAAIAFAQEGPNTNPTAGPPMTSWQQVNGYTGTDIIYICFARSLVQSRSANAPLTISAASNAAAVVFTSTGHGFPIPTQLVVRPTITIKGGTGNWTAINHTFTATIIDANSFSIPVDSTAFGALTGTITFTTTAPRLNFAEWAVELFTYDASHNNLGSVWLGGNTGLAQKCSDATSTTLNVQ